MPCTFWCGSFYTSLWLGLGSVVILFCAQSTWLEGTESIVPLLPRTPPCVLGNKTSFSMSPECLSPRLPVPFLSQIERGIFKPHLTDLTAVFGHCLPLALLAHSPGPPPALWLLLLHHPQGSSSLPLGSVRPTAPSSISCLSPALGASLFPHRPLPRHTSPSGCSLILWWNTSSRKPTGSVSPKARTELLLTPLF